MNEGTEGVNHLSKSTQMKLPPPLIPFSSPVTFPVLFFINSVPAIHPHLVLLSQDACCTQVLP